MANERISFRGKLGDGGQEVIHLSGGDTDTGYRIVKLVAIPGKPFNSTQESSIQIYRNKQTSIGNTVDFSDETLLAVALYKQNDSINYMAYDTVVFDNIVVNQDIYVVCYDAATGEELNYYIEMEKVKMTNPQIAVINYEAALLHGD